MRADGPRSRNYNVSGVLNRYSKVQKTLGPHPQTSKGKLFLTREFSRVRVERAFSETQVLKLCQRRESQERNSWVAGLASMLLTLHKGRFPGGWVHCKNGNLTKAQ